LNISNASWRFRWDVCGPRSSQSSKDRWPFAKSSRPLEMSPGWIFDLRAS
jgi:hypothetical protein